MVTLVARKEIYIRKDSSDPHLTPKSHTHYAQMSVFNTVESARLPFNSKYTLYVLYYQWYPTYLNKLKTQCPDFNSSLLYYFTTI